IWVAAGTYKPTSGTDRSVSFVMKNNLAIYGGFNGTETMLSQRDWVANVTVLSGDIGTQGDDSDNSLHIIFNDNNGLNSSALLDGFTITKGKANGPSSSYGQSGGGMMNATSSPAISNCIFIGNNGDVSGGGMANYSADPNITSCTFDGNFTGSFGGGGGGIYNDNSSPVIKNCSFTNNNSGFSQGGGIHNVNGSSSQIFNCLFLNNSALIFGGGVFNDGSSPTITNCSFSDNNANNNGNALADYQNSFSTVSNCIFWGNNGSEISNINGSASTINNSIVEGGCPAGSTCTNVLDADPLFVSSTDLHLTQCSPALDAGDDAANSEATDLDGNTRKFDAFAGGSMIDMGAYEFQSAGATLVTYYTDSDGDNYGTGAGQQFCTNPGAGWATQAGDCNDGDAAINPGATEICDGIDNNCNGQIDEGNVCCPSGNILYVNDDATGANNGSSWTDAFTDLQAALSSTCPGITEIWVAAGTYKPTGGTDRTISFVMKNGVSIFGGLAGNEPPTYDLNLRNFATNTSVLSGEIGAAGNADNAYTVVFNDFGLAAKPTKLDGFTVTGGNSSVASGSFEKNNNGGAIYNRSSYLTVANCIITANSAYNTGGGMFNYASDPSIVKCEFTGNSAMHGAGLYNASSDATIIDCKFTGNNSSSTGGGLANKGSDPIVTNCLFSGNTASGSGGGMYNTDPSSPMVTNCTFSGNTASFGGGIYVSNSTPIFKNCIVWGNSSGIYVIPITTPTVANSIVQGGYTPCTNCPNTNGNIDPLFVNNTDLHLQACSPAIDEGDDAANMQAIDLDGNPRKFDAIAGGSLIDLGAYEYQSVVNLTTYYTDADGDNFGTGAGQQFCTNPGAGWASVNGDCDDGNNTVYPNAPELCDGLDNDCDGQIDEGLSTDADGDGHYTPGSCLSPADDCDDGNSAVYPGATEICDGIDNNCDGQIDEGLSTDADGDGH
ncbi:MAG: hypothetical protein D6698_04430, partial [Gammaproteobacteria bacterium]